MDKDFSYRLKKAMDVRKISQSKLSQLTGIAASTISLFTSGHRKPSFDNLKSLADALKVQTDFLMGRVDEMDDNGKSGELHYYFNQINIIEERNIVIDFVKMMASRKRDLIN